MPILVYVVKAKICAFLFLRIVNTRQASTLRRVYRRVDDGLFVLRVEFRSWHGTEPTPSLTLDHMRTRLIRIQAIHFWPFQSLATVLVGLAVNADTRY